MGTSGGGDSGVTRSIYSFMPGGSISLVGSSRIRPLGEVVRALPSGSLSRLPPVQAHHDSRGLDGSQREEFFSDLPTHLPLLRSLELRECLAQRVDLLREGDQIARAQRRLRGRVLRIGLSDQLRRAGGGRCCARG